MSIPVQCECGRQLKAREEFAGKRAECSYCGRSLRIPEIPPELPPSGPPESATAARTAPQGKTVTADREVAAEITEFLDPPSKPVARQKKPVSLRPMFEALLDPRSIQWMLILGGGLAVLGLVIWLASAGVFENKVVLAATLIAGSLVVLAAGWFVVLKTRYRIAGQALTFLACVVAPLNLWFLHAQDLVTVEGHLWLGGIVCCFLYAATVYVLRDPLFMYAVEAGVMLTVGLILSEMGRIRDIPSLAIFLMALGLISIHSERAFSPEEGPFPRKRFGMPLFWSGHAQLGLSLLILLWAQLTGWMADPLQQWFGIHWQGNLLSDWTILGGGLWLAGTYAYLYSDIVVRRVGVYTFLAAFCFLLAEVTLVGRWQGEGVIAILSLTAIAAIAVQSYVAKTNERISRAVLPMAMGLSVLPMLIGLGLHIRATSSLAVKMSQEYGWDYQTGGWFFAVMLLAAVCNRTAAFLYRRTASKWSAAYFFLSAAALIVAAAGLLRWQGVTEWTRQAPWLMLIPLAYVVASRLWRGHSPAAPLYWVAQASTAVIMLHVLAATVTSLETLLLALQPVHQQPENLLLGLVFAEAAVFYSLGMFFRRRSANVYLAAAAACAALWQLLHYVGFPGFYYTPIYAALGVGLIAISRSLGLEKVPVYRITGTEGLALRGRGLAVFQTGNAIVSFSLLAAFFQGLTRLAQLRGLPGIEWEPVFALALAIVASLAAACLVPSGGWRRTYATATVALGAVLFLTLNLQIDLTGWQKLEIFCVIAGVLMVASSYVGRFRETGTQENEMVSVGLFLGSLLAAVPLLTAVICHRYSGHFSLPDELALLVVTVLMLLTGVSWQIKSTTFFGGVSLVLYLLIFVISLSAGLLDRQWIIGISLAVGGSLIFAAGIGLSVYREKLLQLPEQIASRQGVFRVLNWR